MLRISAPDGLQPSFYSIWRSAFRKEGCREPQPATFHVKHTPEPASGSWSPAIRRSPRSPPPIAPGPTASGPVNYPALASPSAPPGRRDLVGSRNRAGRARGVPGATGCPAQMLAPRFHVKHPRRHRKFGQELAGLPVPAPPPSRHRPPRGRIKAEPRVGIILAAPPPMPDWQGVPKMGHGGPASPRRFLGEGPAQCDRGPGG